MRMQVAGAAVAAALLTGCTSAPLTELRGTAPQGSATSQALARGYAQFAAVELTEMLDLKDGDYFARKGLAAVRGEEPVPEKVADWRVPDKDVAYLSAERNRLAAALANRADGAVPETVAAAQLGYDCWIEQQEEGFQPADIEACRALYAASVDMLERRKDYPHSIFFALNGIDLTPAETARVQMLAARALRLEVPRITVLGHADSTGSERHNLRLSLHRADTVKRALVRAGIAPDRVGVAAAGESRQRVATGDGVAEPANRRVEVLFQPKVRW